ncbi:MAG: lysophospholipid acyltransferase family protein [Spongiibacteraceae bacterium]|jgi:1-acyl-sn-glycerol-3-phosphate acyltransferase|nr:lysophospholipid acyltransferase family protein [Spongiibacteraceae bacterium]
MARTVFRTPLIAPLLRGLARLLLALSGWRVVGEIPRLQRFVLIGAPHTSNWDFILMLLAILTARLDVHWMGKDSLFPAPVGGLMRWLGGIPIDRSKPSGVVAQMVERYAETDALIVLIPPEGTRSRVERWKTGFYHIAAGAEVPIVLGYIDASRKELGFGPAYQPSGDIERDLPEIQHFYHDKRGLRR